MKILSDIQEEVLQHERSFLHDLRIKLEEFGVEINDLKTIDRSISQLDDLFLLVVVGEFNAGKSAVINALLGERRLKEGVTPTTSQINILRFGSESERHTLEEGHEVITMPVALLSEVSIVDTPGTNAIIRQHEELTRHFVPRADLVLFITSVDRPFTESERQFMGQIRDWGKKVVIVLNKIDLLQDEEELVQVEDFVRENARNLLGVSPEIFPVSARHALHGKTDQPGLWDASRFVVLETYIQETLDDLSQVQLKLLNPLGVSDHLVNHYYQAAEEQRSLLDEDLALLRNVSEQQSIYQADKTKEFSLHMADVENIFLEMEQRGDEFFEEHFRLVHVFDLIKKKQLQENFTTDVVADVPKRVERKVDGLIDWLVESDLRQWKAVTTYLADRRGVHKEYLIGDGFNEGFTYDRGRLLDAIGAEAERVVSNYDRQLESEKIAFDAQNAVAASLAMEVGAVGLGTLITALASTAAADITGVVAAGLIAALGFFIIPASRRKAKKDLHERLANLRTNLVGALRKEFEKEIRRSIARIEEAVGPYSRFVRAESKRAEGVMEDLGEATKVIDSLRSKIEGWKAASDQGIM